MSIYAQIRDLKMSSTPEQVSPDLLTLLSGERCVTAEDRCVALIALCESLHSRILDLELTRRPSVSSAIPQYVVVDDD